MSIPGTATSDLQRLTNFADLSGHDRGDLNRMMVWKLKGWWHRCLGPKPGEKGCQVAPGTMELFEEPSRGGGG